MENIETDGIGLYRAGRTDTMEAEYMLMNGMADLSSGNTSFSVALKQKS